MSISDFDACPQAIYDEKRNWGEYNSVSKNWVHLSKPGAIGVVFFLKFLLIYCFVMAPGTS